MKRLLFSAAIFFSLFLTSTGSTFAAVTWSETQPAGDTNQSWTPSAISSDGQKMIVGNQGGGLYISSNGGISWSSANPTEFEPTWYVTSMSANGQTILAGVYGGRLYLSTNGGSSWSETRPRGDNDVLWLTSSMSSDGEVMLVSNESGRLYRTTNGGDSWSEIRPAGDKDATWYTAVSSNGQTMLVSEDDGSGGRVYISTNTGDSWTETQPAGNADNGWRTVSMSSDGQVMLAAIFSGSMYLSTNGGDSWTETQPAGNASGLWVQSSISSDGQTLYVNGTQRLYISTNGGNSWTETQPIGNQDGNWQLMSMSGDAQAFLAGNYDARLYLISNPLPSSTGSSSSSSSTTPAAPTCGAAVPGGTPDLFQIDTTSTKAKLYFSPVNGNTDSYMISYGYTPGDMRFGAEVDGNSGGVMSYTLNYLTPNTTYYVQVRAGNGCATGGWSNTMKFTTSQKGSTSGNRFYENFAMQVISNLSNLISF